VLNPTICGCGCLQPIFEGDYLGSQGWLFNHSRRDGSPSYLIQDMGYKTPCWMWQGCLNKWGYAKIKRRGKTQGGHRLFYRAYIDPSLPDSRAGSDGLDHLCRIRKCVRPDHVEPVTCVENIRRGLVHALADPDIRSIAERYERGESQRQIAISLGVHQPEISRILNGLRWRGQVRVVPTRSPIKLSPEQVDELRQRAASGEIQRDLAVHFGIGQSQVSRIVRGECWTATT
jgi:predicted XRE-type DNA-binding protein